MAFSYCFMPYAKVWHQCPKIPVRPKSVLPVMASDNFERSFADEFYFFRRKSYYSGAYAGKTAGSAAWQHLSKPYPGKWVNRNGVMVSQTTSTFGAMQGPQLFWTPEFGLSLVSMNWNLYTRWNAWLTDGKTQDWPSYFTSTAKYDKGKKELVLTHKFRKTPCTIERKLVFGEKDLKIHLKRNGNSAGKKLVEQLPFLSKTGVTVSYCINGKWQANPGSKVTAIRWKNAKNAAVIVKFSAPVTVRKGITSRSQIMTVESIEAEIGTEKEFSYTVSAEK